MERRVRLAAMVMGILCVAVIRGQLRAAALSDSALVEARNKAASCLARDFDGGAFRDPYLTYVYPDERLPTPAGPAVEPGFTYRAIDANIMLVLLKREGSIPPSLQPAVDRAGQVLGKLPRLWNGRGFSNVRRSPRTDGIALDTFCIVGWLESDRSMAQAAAQALDGDAWLPEELYDGEQRFRRDADECWCLRLLASLGNDGIGSARRVFDRVISDFRSSRREDPSGRQTFYAAYHLGLLLAESEDLGNAVDPAALRAEVEEALETWAAARPAGREQASDILEWANLATSKLPGLDRTGLRRRSLEVILRHQSADGCWRVSGAEPPQAGSSFLTLCALLALSSYREP